MVVEQLNILYLKQRSTWWESGETNDMKTEHRDVELHAAVGRWLLMENW